MSQIMPSKLFKAGEPIFKEEDAPDGLYYICEGKVKITRRENGQEVILATLEKESVFGEMALINSRPRNATVTALEDTWVYLLNVNGFQHKVEQLDPVMRGVFRILVMTIRNLTGTSM